MEHGKGMPGEKGPAQQDGASFCCAAARLIGDVPAGRVQLSQEGLLVAGHGVLQGLALGTACLVCRAGMAPFPSACISES